MLKRVVRGQIHKLRDFLRISKRFAVRCLFHYFHNTENHFVLFVEDALKRGQDEAIENLKRQKKFVTPRHVKVFLDLISSLQSQMDKVLLPVTEKRRFIIHIPCWGADYGAKCGKFLLASFLAKNNLPWLLGKVDLVLLFHCDDESKAEISNSPSFTPLTEIATIKFIVLPAKTFTLFKRFLGAENHPFSKYQLLAILQNFALKLGFKENAYVSFQHPDLVISNSFYRTLFENSKDKVLGVTLGLCAKYSCANEELGKFYTQNDKSVLEIPASDLNHFQVKHINPRSLRYIISTKRSFYSVASFLIFKQGNSLIVRSKHYHPYLVDFSKVSKKFQMSASPIDDDNLSNMIDPNLPVQSQVFVCDSSLASGCELSEADFEEAKNKIESLDDSIKALIPCFLHLTPLQKFLLPIRLKISAPESSLDVEDIDDVEFIERLEKEILKNDRLLNLPQEV